MSRHLYGLIALVAFSLAASAATLPYDRTCPVIYDNDGAIESGLTDEYVMALASSGTISLRGIISTGTNGMTAADPLRTEDSILFERSEVVPKARRSGLRNLPDATPGPGNSMNSRRPSSGRIEDTVPYGSKGGWLIVNEARKATAAKPLVIVMGGQATAVADAYLLDNSIADKVVLAWLMGNRRYSNGAFDAYEYNAYVDSWATYIVFERFRAVAFPVDTSEGTAQTPKSRLYELPATELRQMMLDIQWPGRGGLDEQSLDWDSEGAFSITRSDFVTSTRRISFDHWEADRWGGPNLLPVWKEDPNGRVQVAWSCSSAVATDEWWIHMKDPATWGPAVGQIAYNTTPWSVPGKIEAELFDHGGPNVAYADTTNNWTNEAWFNPFRYLEHVDLRASANASGGYKMMMTAAGEWEEYTVAVANSATYTLNVAVASNGGGGTFHVEFNGVDRTGPIAVPNSGGWDTWQIVSKAGIALNAGTYVMRVVMDANGATANIGDMDYFQLIASSTPALPVVTVAASDANASETGPDTAAITVSRTGSTGSALTVAYSMSGSASNGADYNALPGTITIPSGQSSATIVVTPVDDALVEGSETAVLTLSANSGYSVGSPASASIAIADNDSATSTVTGVLLGRTGEDLVAQTSETPNGVLDVHIRLDGVPGAIKSVRITASSGIWATPFNGSNWVVGIRPQSANPSTVDLYFDYWQTLDAYTIALTFNDGSTQTLTAKTASTPSGLQQGGFETPNVGSSGTYGSFQYAPSGSAWAFSANAGISANSSGFTSGNPGAPEGVQVAFVQGISTVSQNVTLAAGTYAITFRSAQRLNWQASWQTIRVQVDGTTISDFRPSSGSYETDTTNSFTLGAGSHQISFVGLNANGGDNTAFIDNVAIVTASAGDPSLLGWWKCDDGSGASATDASGKGNTLSLLNGPSWTSGVSSGGLSFDGVNDAATRGQVSGLGSGNAPHSIVAWVKVTSLPANRAWIMLLGNAGGGAHHWLINNSGGTQFGVWNGAQVNPTLPVGQWRRVATTFDGSTLKGYVDGVQIGSTPATFNLQGVPLSWGQNFNGENYFQGVVDDIRLYNRALSATEIQSLSQVAVPTGNG